MTSSPAALVEHSADTQGLIVLCKRMTEHRSSRDERRDVFAWVPASSFGSGGAFEIRKLEGKRDKSRYASDTSQLRFY